MQSTIIVPEILLFEIDFLKKNYIPYVYDFGLYLKLNNDFIQPTLMTAHMQQYYHEDEAGCIGEDCPACDVFDKLVRMDQYIRQADPGARIPYQDLVFYLNALFVQNEFILENLSSLIIHYPALGDFSKYVEFFNGLSRDIIEMHTQFMRRIIEEKNNDASRYTPVQYRDCAMILEGVSKKVNEVVLRYEAIHQKYKTRVTDLIYPIDFFRIYKAQLEALIMHASSRQGSKKAELKMLGSSAILAKLEECKHKIEDPYYHVFYTILCAREAYHVQRQPSKALNYIADADAQRKKILADQATSENNAEELLISINTIHLSFLTLRLRNNPKNTLSEIQAALALTVDLPGPVSRTKPVLKSNLKLPLIYIFDSLLSYAQEKFLFVRTLEDLPVLKEYLGQLQALVSLYEKTGTESTVADTANDVNKLQSHCTRYANALKTKESLLKAKRAENEKMLVTLNKADEEYNKLFPKLLAAFREEKRKQMPVKPMLMPDIKPNKPETQPIEKAPEPQVKTIARQCADFFQTHRLRESANLIHQFDDQDKPEVMLYIGDKYLPCHHYERALHWYQQAVQSANAMSGLNPELERGLKFSLNNCELMLQAEYEYVQREYERSIASRQTFKLNLVREMLSAQQLKLLSEEEINQLAELEFSKLGQRNEAEGKELSAPAKKRLAIAEHRKMLKASLTQSDALHDHANQLFEKAGVQGLSVTANPATLFGGKTQSPKKPAKRRANRRRK